MKKLILLYGLPGSGKSTLAQKLEKEYEDQGLEVFTIETDEWFVRHGRGTYKFDASVLNDAHSWTFRKVTKAMTPDWEASDSQDSYDVIILANTNLTWRDIRGYVELAVHNDYEVEIVEAETPWRYNLDELETRGVHRVPREALERMNKKRQPVEYLREKIKQASQRSYEW